MSMRLLGAGMLVCLLTARAGAADVNAKHDRAALLVGKWVVARSGGEPPVGFTMEFTREGRFKFSTPTKAGKEMSFEGVFKVEGDKLQITRMRGGQEEKAESLVIKKLTGRQLVLQGGKNVAELRRIR